MRSPAPRSTLVCLHQAGGGPALFDSWVSQAPAELRVLPVELPTHGQGVRGRRRYRRVDDLVPALADELSGRLRTGRYVIFGHSMGALIAYLLTRHLLEGDGPGPQALVVACYGAPHLYRPVVCEQRTESSVMVAWLREIGGIPNWLAEQPRLLEPFLDLLRDDLELCLSYRHVPQPRPLSLPVHVFAAAEDRLVPEPAVRRWADVGSDVRTTILPGGHFLVGEDGGVLPKHVFTLFDEEMR